MGYSKVVINGTTKLDLTQDTVEASVMVEGYTAHDKAGNPVEGSIPVKTVDSVTESDDGKIVIPSGYYANEVIYTPTSLAQIIEKLNSLEDRLDDLDTKTYLRDGFDSYDKEFNDNGEVIVSVSTDNETNGMKLTKTLTDGSHTITTVLTDREDTEIAKLVKVVSEDGKTISATMTLK